MAKKQVSLLQMEFFDEIASVKISPDEYYLLCCLRDSISPAQIDTKLVLKATVEKGWVEAGEKHYVLTPKSLKLIEKLERLFVITKKKTPTRLMGKNYKEKIAKYREMFPNKVLPSGKRARSAPKNLETAFAWFFQNYDYDWPIIFKATTKYVNDYQKKGDKFMRTSQFFIRKLNMSDLADICDAIRSGSEPKEEPGHSVKVV